MKTTLTAILTALIITTALAVDPPKRCAFGPIQFGESAEDAQAHLQTLLNTMKRPLTVADALQKFVGTGSKYPPKLTPRYAKQIVTVNFNQEPVLSYIKIQTTSMTEANYNGTVRDAWEIFRDLAIAKFGAPTTAATAMPSAESLVLGYNQTDEWNLPTQNLHLTLSITCLGTAGENRRYDVVLRADDTTAH